MEPIFITQSVVEDFCSTRRRSSERFQFGTPSLAVVIIERAAGRLRRAASAVERWAAGPTDVVAPQSLSTR